MSGDGGVAARKPRHRSVIEAILGDIAAGRFRPGERLPTEAELAKTFSASRSTVGRAMRELQNRGLLSRQRGSGTHVARQDSKRIALFTPFTHNASDLGFIGGQIHAHLSQLASHRGDHLRLQLINRADGELLDQMMAAARAIIEQGVAGVFYYPRELPAEQVHYNKLVVDKLLSAEIAVVAVDRDIVSFPQRSSLPLITYDNRRGGYLLTEHLLKKGRKRIAFIGSPFVSSAASDRLRGYCDALEDNGLIVDKSLIRRATADDLDAAFCQSLMAECKPDAIVCKMDQYAALVGRHLLGMGIAIGRDVMLAGFDDEPWAELLPVPLTTIRFPADPFALMCYERLASLMGNPSTVIPVMSLVDVELVIRESTAG